MRSHFGLQPTQLPTTTARHLYFSITSLSACVGLYRCMWLPRTLLQMQFEPCKVLLASNWAKSTLQWLLVLLFLTTPPFAATPHRLCVRAMHAMENYISGYETKCVFGYAHCGTQTTHCGPYHFISHSVFYWKIQFGPRPRHISIGARLVVNYTAGAI